MADPPLYSRDAVRAGRLLVFFACVPLGLAFAAAAAGRLVGAVIALGVAVGCLALALIIASPP